MMVHSIPYVDDAVAAHGTDPIYEYPVLQVVCDHDFSLMFPSTELFENIYSDGVLFQRAILS